jgi:hypothetical protein
MNINTLSYLCDVLDRVLVFVRCRTEINSFALLNWVVTFLILPPCPIGRRSLAKIDVRVNQRDGYSHAPFSAMRYRGTERS